ncbi:L-threonylcarbamoyladenylate synthase [Polycladidibacter stylochi]|uniref:L-threonylcarbamoyladenylate synthase n=1 Tax=Polycladidibacter stylochi TaxID=1807766 RepID=UPI000833A603
MKRWTLPCNDKTFTTSVEFAEVCQLLKQGDLVALPTETVYGLAADATNGQACARIYSAKGRPQFNPLISHVEDLGAARQHGVFNLAANKLAEAFWPGPLTLVVPKLPNSPVSALVTAGLDSIALRVPNAPIMQALAKSCGVPLAAPSANLSGKISGTTADDVAADLSDSLAYLIDGGPTKVGIESTIVSLVGSTPTLLRPGGISREAIEAVLDCTLATAGHNNSAPSAPGMLSSHYAPNATLRLNALEVLPGEALLAFGQDLPESAHVATGVINLSPSRCLEEAAANLFSALRAADKLGTNGIAAMPIPMEGLGEAINDRLKRAAAPR